MLFRSERVATYERALAAYRARQFEAAATAFQGLAGDDQPARMFLERARGFVAAPPAEGWDGVMTLEEK